jgi:hypothetical protein
VNLRVVVGRRYSLYDNEKKVKNIEEEEETMVNIFMGMW